MAQSRSIMDKVEAYLGGLSPTAREMLLRKLEQSSARGELDPAARMILDAARMPPRPQTPKTEPVAAPVSAAAAPIEELFFAPFELYATQEDLVPRVPGRLSRSSFAPLWHYFQRELASDLLKPWSNGARPANLNTAAQIEIAADDLRRKVFERGRKHLADLGDSSRNLQKIIGHIGGERVFHDMQDMLALNERRNALNSTLRAMPDGETLDAAQEKQALQAIQRHLDANAQDALWLASAMASRPATAFFLPRLAVLLAGASSAAVIRNSSGMVFMSAAISELHRQALRFLGIFARHGSLDEAMRALKFYSDLNRAILGAVVVDDDETWRVAMANERRHLSDKIRIEVEAVIAAIRRALATSGPVAASPEARRPDTDDAVRLVTLLFQGRRYKEALALNEVATRLVAAVEQTMEAANTRLVTELARAGAEQRPVIASAMDSALEICTIVFGEDYATQLRRRQQAALKGAA